MSYIFMPICFFEIFYLNQYLTKIITHEKD